MRSKYCCAKVILFKNKLRKSNPVQKLIQNGLTYYREFKNKLSELVLPPGLFSPGGYLTANVWDPPYL